MHYTIALCAYYTHLYRKQTYAKSTSYFFFNFYGYGFPNNVLYINFTSCILNNSDSCVTNVATSTLGTE